MNNTAGKLELIKKTMDEKPRAEVMAIEDAMYKAKLTYAEMDYLEELLQDMGR